MKVALLLAMLLFAGCSPLAKITRFGSPTYVYATRSHPAAYQYSPDGEIGDSIGYLELMIGDSIPTFGARDQRSQVGTYHYIALKGSDTVYVAEGQVYDEYDYLVSKQSPKFRLPKSQDPTAWGRATQWVIERSNMKIQTTSENLIQTFNPEKGWHIGFTITRIPMGDEVEYDVKVVSNNYGDASYRSQQRCAFYMVTGRKH